MAVILNRAGLAFRAVMTQKMLAEANWAADRLKLPTKRPIQITDIKDLFISMPSGCVLQRTNPPFYPDTVFGTNIFNPNIPRDARLRALKIGPNGRIDTANFEFRFYGAQLAGIMRLSAPRVEYYADNLDALIGRKSLIDTNGAWQLATQWLAAVDMDMAALSKLKHSVSQLHYLLRGATNTITLPIYYVDIGTRHFPACGLLKAYDTPMVTVEVLGTTKTLQNVDLAVDFGSDGIPYDNRPPLLITNALDLIRAPNPPTEQLKKAPSLKPIGTGINLGYVDFNHVNFITHIQTDMLLNDATIKDAIQFAAGQPDTGGEFSPNSMTVYGFWGLTFGLDNY
ncbi:MAG: hypothetical protein KGR98_00515 [Verrucomicrobia bacterium]|nr:hypothetical protein [Verrucomicrobiota bacterium]MDE3099018.1 hypothetical protein [Verrucomicrobiota bacterium]